MARKSQFLVRLFRPYFFALALVLTVGMLTLYFASVEYTKNNAYNSAEQLAQKTAQQTDTYIDELNLLAEQVMRQPNILNMFYRLKSDNNPENYFKEDILNNLDISSSLKNLLVGREHNSNIIIYNGSGDIISSQEYTLSVNSCEITSGRYNEMLSRVSKNDSYIIFPNKNVWTSSDETYITLVKAMKNSYSDDICGIIEVRGNTDDFINSIVGDMDSGYSISICDRTTGETTPPLPRALTDETIKTVTSPLNNTNWEIEIDYMYPINTAFKVQLILVMIVVYILLLFMAFRITKLIGRSVLEPLIKLTDHVHTIHDTDTPVNLVDDKAIDEIQELEVSFGEMFERINYLVNQEKKAYSLALQAQMNPHFLYNTLAVIGSAGEEGGCENVSDMCLKLSDMLRYVTEYETVTVPLKDEIEHTQNYLSLMKSRYEDYFSYSIDVEKDLLNMPVPKLFIQPLAENCFKHGFKEKAPPWNISIKMRGVESVWTLEIKDNGTGISDEKIEAISTQISKAISEKKFNDTAGLGIANTIIRLKMTHNEKIDYSITNDNGMKIKIVSGKEGGKSDV